MLFIYQFINQMSFRMFDVTISQILNEIDQMEYALYTEWKSTSFKIMLFKPSAIPLMGEMLDNGINYYSEEHSKSCDEYLKETKNAFSGKDTEVQYFLQDDKFEWRRNKKWILGNVTVHPISNIVLISETLYGLLKRQQDLQEVLSKLKKENESLIDTKKELCVTIEEMIQKKIEMEKELYQKFILILNAKKNKIRELNDLLKNKTNKRETVFDACTDQSEDSDTNQEDMNNRINTKKRLRRPVSKKSKSAISSDSEDEMKDVASTSKEMHKTIPNDKERIPVESSTSNDESECELELKMPESCTTKPNISNLDFEEESEEELFS